MSAAVPPAPPRTTTAPTDAPAQLAEFATAGELRAAVDRLWALGYRELEAYSPYVVEGVAERLGRGRGGVPLITLAGAVLGATASYAIQWWANVRSYPLNIGGRPQHPVPAFIVPTFEGMVLGAALAAFVGLLLGLRLPRLWHAEHAIPGFERATVDRFWVRVDPRDVRAADAALTARELASLQPLRVVREEAEA